MTTRLDALDRLLSRSRLSPLWWRLPTWVGLTVAIVIVAQGTAARITSGLLFGVGALALQFVRHPSQPVRRTALISATALGLAACFPSSSGIGIVLVGVAAARAVYSFDHAALTTYTVTLSVLVSVTIALVAHSWYGLLSGTAVPFLVEREREHLDLVRERDRATALLVEAEAGRDAETQAAALRERGRIAREMHDVLAHSLAGLSVQLQAVRAIATREGVGRDVLDPLDTAAALAKDGLTEARAAVGALRDPGGLGLDALPRLVDRQPGDARLDVAGAAGEVSPEAGHAVYRAVQESLTNAARYAPGADVTVRLSWEPAELRVEITDSGRTRDAVAGPGTGLGLAGMSERLEAVGGTVSAGPHGPGWRVLVTVPRSNS